jgi:hypothetical protein
MPQILLEIKSCKKCPHFEERRMYTADNFENAYDWSCKKVRGKVIAEYVEWTDKSENK